MANKQPTGSGCLTAVLQFLGFKEKDPAQPEIFPYAKQEFFLSPAEINFFHTLRAIVEDDYHIFTKVRLADIFEVEDRKNNLGSFNKISQRHIDFLLCEPSDITPVLGLELDDSSHSAEQSSEKDRFKNAVFQAAGLPLLRIPVQNTYDFRAIAFQIAKALRPRESDVVPGIPQDDQDLIETPSCPNCGGEMMIRTASRGKFEGKDFYVCLNYKECKGILPAGSTES